MSWIPEDIEKPLRADFGADANSARVELKKLTGVASDAALPRIARCVVHLADRELDMLTYYVECADPAQALDRDVDELRVALEAS